MTHNSRSSLLQVRDEDILKQISKYEEEPKPCYYSDQIRLSSEIIKRIKLILKKYNNGKTLNDFSEFDYQIYTSKSTTLREQTKSRLEHPLSGCIPPNLYAGLEKDLHEYSNERVSLYVISNAAEKRHKELLQDAKDNPNKLFLIVADEAHWGIVAEQAECDEDEEKSKTKTKRKGKKKRKKKIENIKSARDKYIDTWTSEHKNVIVLLVSATPYNLMTEETHLPLDQCCAEFLESGELIAVQPSGDGTAQSERLMNENEKDVTHLVGPVKRLHHVQWTEIFASKLQEAKESEEEDEEELKIQFILKSLAYKSTVSCNDPVYLVPALDLPENGQYRGVCDIQYGHL